MQRMRVPVRVNGCGVKRSQADPTSFKEAIGDVEMWGVFDNGGTFLGVLSKGDSTIFGGKWGTPIL